jgi:hypothetical protein
MTKRRVAEPTAEYAVKRKPTNLSLEAEAIRRGEAKASELGISLSELVNQLLLRVPEAKAPFDESRLSGPVGRLYGIARGAYASSEEAIEDYRRYLARKHGVE